MREKNNPGKPRNLTVLGTGFAAVSLLRRIDKDRYDVVIVSPRNHFLFTPLLPSTTVGTIEFRSIIEPIRTADPHAEYYQAACTAIDPARRRISCAEPSEAGGFELAYDTLVIAVGADNHTYGVPGVDEHAHFLRQLADARAIRQTVISCLERASVPGLPEPEILRLLHFVVVGGGPTGVEFAAELCDFLRHDVRRWYPVLAKKARISLIEAHHHLLGSFDEVLSAYAAKLFQREGIEVLTDTMVEAVHSDHLSLKGGEEMPYGMVVWSTGIAPTGLVKALPFEKDHAGRLITDDHLRVKGQTGIYAIGDSAMAEGQALPATAQTAQQQGKYLAKALNRVAAGRRVGPFAYRHMGMLAYVGSQRALADLPQVKGRGFATWLFWRSAYLTKLVSWKNKILVVFDWLKTAIFGRDISWF